MYVADPTGCTSLTNNSVSLFYLSSVPHTVWSHSGAIPHVGVSGYTPDMVLVGDRVHQYRMSRSFTLITIRFRRSVTIPDHCHRYDDRQCRCPVCLAVFCRHFARKWIGPLQYVHFLSHAGQVPLPSCCFYWQYAHMCCCRSSARWYPFSRSIGPDSFACLCPHAVSNALLISIGFRNVKYDSHSNYYYCNLPLA